MLLKYIMINYSEQNVIKADLFSDGIFETEFTVITSILFYGTLNYVLKYKMMKHLKMICKILRLKHFYIIRKPPNKRCLKSSSPLKNSLPYL